MNLTQLFATAWALAFVATSPAFADQTQAESKPQQQEETKKPSGESAEPPKSITMHRGIDPATRELFNKASTWFSEDMKSAEELLRQARNRYQDDKLTEAESLANKAIASSAAMARAILQDSRYLGINMASQFAPQTRFSQEDARHLIAKIRIKQRFYDDALKLLLADWRQVTSEGGDQRRELDIALCYVRKGNEEMARKYAIERAISRYVSDDSLSGLPNASTSRGLEAQILFIQGADAANSLNYKEAFAKFNAAGQLLPENGLIAYKAGMALSDLKRYGEAAPYFHTAIQRLDDKSSLMSFVKEQEQNAVFYARRMKEIQAALKLMPKKERLEAEAELQRRGMKLP